MKLPPDKSKFPNSFVAHRFVCGCFGIAEKDLTLTLERMRKITSDADKHFPRKLSGVMLMRAENGKGPWQDALFTLHREALYEALKDKLLTKQEGRRRNVQSFYSLPAPKAVWTKTQPLQNQDFAAFIAFSFN